MSSWRVSQQLRCLDLVAAFLLEVSSAVCIRQPLTASEVARFRLPAWASVHAWLLRLRTVFDSALERLPVPDPVCTCPPLCAGALWPMPAWVCRDIRSVFLVF